MRVPDADGSCAAQVVEGISNVCDKTSVRGHCEILNGCIISRESGRVGVDQFSQSSLQVIPKNSRGCAARKADHLKGNKLSIFTERRIEGNGVGHGSEAAQHWFGSRTHPGRS